MKITKLTSKAFWSTLLLLAFIGMFSTVTVYGGGKNKVEYLYDLKEALTLEAQVYRMSGSPILSLFPVPFDNAVGTNDITNAITVFSFPEGKLDQEHHFRRALGDIQGGGTYLPVITPDLIGFARTRAFYLFNFKTQKAEEYRIVFAIDETIEKIAIADAQRRRFIFEVEEHKRGSVDSWDISHNLQLIDLSGKKVNLIKKLPEEKGATWAVAYDRVLLWYFKKKEMQVYDMNLEPSQHPLADVIMKNKNNVDFTWPILHPALPFAILAGGKQGSSSINWSKDRDNKPILFLSGAKQFLFSPDGKWATFKREDYANDKSYTYLMPVSEKYPHYLGTPISLKNDYFNADNCGWTKNPIAFVASDGDLHRWKLTKEAQRAIMGDDYDKYETFHDWIVAKDLEKLTKEKKQGLGK